MWVGVSGPFPFITNSPSSGSHYQKKGALAHPLSEMAFSLPALFHFICDKPNNQTIFHPEQWLHLEVFCHIRMMYRGAKALTERQREGLSARRVNVESASTSEITSFSSTQLWIEKTELCPVQVQEVWSIWVNMFILGLTNNNQFLSD